MHVSSPFANCIFINILYQKHNYSIYSYVVSSCHALHNSLAAHAVAAVTDYSD